MTGFDIVVLVLVGLGAVTGFMRGFVQEVLSLAAWIFSLAMIHYLHTPLSAFLVNYVDNESAATVLAFALLLLVPYAAVKVIAGALGRASRASLLGPIDRVLGFGFGALKGIIIVVLAFSIVVLGYDLVWGQSGRPLWITQARSYQFVDASSQALVQIIGQRREALRVQDAKADHGN